MPVALFPSPRSHPAGIHGGEVEAEGGQEARALPAAIFPGPFPSLSATAAGGAAPAPPPTLRSAPPQRTPAPRQPHRIPPLRPPALRPRSHTPLSRPLPTRPPFPRKMESGLGGFKITGNANYLPYTDEELAGQEQAK